MGLIDIFRKKSEIFHSKHGKKRNFRIFSKVPKPEKRLANLPRFRNGRNGQQESIASSPSSSILTIRASSSSIMVDTEDAVAAADKQMEERAARAKALLANRYKGLRTEQVRTRFPSRECVNRRKYASEILTFSLFTYRKIVMNEK
jgi:hypothetical protein